MLRNYFKIALRNGWKHRLFSVINIVGLAALIALPLGYGLGLVFLSNFAYRVSIGLETLGVCVAVLGVVGGATVGWRTYRAALANPADSLRAE